MEDNIFIYTANEAINDGWLHEVGKLAKEAGFIFPVRITSGVLELVAPSEESKKFGQSLEGRLWDVLWMAKLAIQKTKDKFFTSFKVIFADGQNNQNEVELWACLDNTSGPAIHIILPSEY